MNEKKDIKGLNQIGIPTIIMQILSSHEKI